MSRVIKNERLIEKFIKKQGVKMPIFKREADGSWSFDGNFQEISTLEEFKQYKDVFSEMMDYINANFKSSVSKIYKNALNTLICEQNGCKVSNLYNDMLSGKSIGEGKLILRGINNENSANKSKIDLMHVVGLVNAKNGVKKRFKPFEIRKLLGNNDKKLENINYILPEFTDAGIVSKIEDGVINVNLNAVSSDEAEAVRDYMLSQVQDNSNPQNADLRRLVEVYFETSRALAGNISNGNARDIYKSTQELVELSLNFFNDDPTEFLKKKRNFGFHSFFKDDLEDKALEGNDGPNDEPYDEGFEFSTDNNSHESGYVDVDKLSMHAPFVSEAEVGKTGNMIINLKATQGSFVVKLDNNVMDIYQKGQEPNLVEEQPQK